MVVIVALRTSSGGMGVPEKRLDENMTVADLKERVLYMHFGISPENQHVALIAGDGDRVGLADDSATLLQYGIGDGMIVEVEDTSPVKENYQDVSEVEKYEMSEEAYDSRKNTFRKFKQQLEQEGVITPTTVSEKKPAEEDESHIATIIAGSRCLATYAKPPFERRGTVRYVGAVPQAGTGTWVGIELDDPYGKGDGSINGARYFECMPKHASFIRPNKVEVGDYPPEDDFSDLDEI